MLLKEIKEKNIWEGFLKDKEKTFLQSWNWAEFQRSLGEKIFRWAVFEEGEILSVCLAIKVKAKRGNFLLVPHGPVIAKRFWQKKKEILEFLTAHLKNLGQKEKVAFLRLASLFEENKENQEIFKNLGYLKAPIHIHPETTWVVDISASEEKIFSGFRKVCRNLIRRAQKEGAEIEKIKDISGVEVFNKIYQETAKRQNFVPFSKEYLQKEFAAFLKDDQILVFLAKHQGKILASSFIIFYDKVAYYHQGASLPSKIPAPYLLQWEVIREAKKRGCLLYNMWGVAPIKKEVYFDFLKKEKKINPYQIFEKTHPWFGLSLFKTGFGGKAVFYLKTQDLPISKRYWLNWIIEKARKRRRHL